MQEYEANTCIKFKKRTNEESYLKIVKGAVKKCSSKIGWHKYGGRMNLVPEGMNVGSILHELGHVIGFRHEHNRPDRDQYLNINFENVAKGVEAGRLPGEDMLLVETSPSMERNALKYDSRLWPGGVVIYEFDGLRLYRGLLRRTMKHISDNTCIQFKERTKEKGYVRIYNGKLFTCFADMGYYPLEQRLSLGLGCRSFGSIVHELGHVLGLYHEQQRPDRDDYVIVYEENLQDGALKEYEKRFYNNTRVIGPFDYESIMLYGENDARKSAFSGETMKAKQPGVTLLNPAQREGLSALDIKKINTLYNCPGKDKFT